MAEYAHPEMLVSTGWVQENLENPDVHIVEVDVDTALYQEGHVPGALGWNWESQLQDQVRRDILSREAFEELMSRSGISPGTTVILYGDNNNWFAAYALWQMKVRGHADVRLMNGGRKKWIQEGRPLSQEIPNVPSTSYQAGDPDESIRARRKMVAEAVSAGVSLVDVRSPDEFTGKIVAPPGLNETAQRPGHIPGAHNIPWGKAANEDGTFKSADELRELYQSEGVNLEGPVIAYCRIGERSSHTWFALKYLVGIPEVRNYDGSWTEWGNLVDAPIERGA